MIKAKLRAGEREVTIVADGGDLRIEGDEAFAADLRTALRPGSISLYNPALGGPYLGVDPADETQVIDGLRKLARMGRADLHVELDDRPRAKPQPYPEPDTRDDRAMLLAALRAGEVTPLGEGEDEATE